jgi:transposase
MRAAFPAGVGAPVLSETRSAAFMAELFGVPLATVTIARISQDCAERCQGFAAAIRDRGAAPRRGNLLAQVTEIVVHDHCEPYTTSRPHASCAVHRALFVRVEGAR